MKQVPQPCCDQWSKAHQHGTDNEGWGALISNYGGKPDMGDGLDPIRFCPWCGAEKGEEKHPYLKEPER